MFVPSSRRSAAGYRASEAASTDTLGIIDMEKETRSGGVWLVAWKRVTLGKASHKQLHTFYSTLGITALGHYFNTTGEKFNNRCEI